MADAGDAASAETPEWLALDDDETVVWSGRPALASIASELAVGLLLLPFLGLGLLVAVPAYLRVQHTEYVVTTKALYARAGVLSESIESVGLDKIQNTEYGQGFWERQFGYGTVGVSTAGSSGIEISFDAIEDARDVQSRINRLSGEYRSRGGDARAGDEGATLDDVRDELRATREALERVAAAVEAERGVVDGLGSGEEAEHRDGD
jgi:membrane protein YdbS with pleckstrin-like domain